MNKAKLKKIEEKVIGKVEDKIFALSAFDEIRPHYLTKITFFDKILANTILKLFPDFVRPNLLTTIRFVSVPFIVFILLNGDYKMGFLLFIISALTDAFDGAIARTRNMITDWGIIFDPFADKLLIGSVGGILVFNFLNPILAIVIISFEIILIATSYYRYRGKTVPAKTSGKTKMILQCVGVGFIFLYLLTSNQIYLTIASYILYLAVLFAVLCLTVYKSI